MVESTKPTPKQEEKDKHEIRIPKNGTPQKYIDDAWNLLNEPRDGENKFAEDPRDRIIVLSASGNAIPIACQTADVLHKKKFEAFEKLYQLYLIKRIDDDNDRKRQLTVLKIFMTGNADLLKNNFPNDKYGFHDAYSGELQPYHPRGENKKGENRGERPQGERSERPERSQGERPQGGERQQGEGRPDNRGPSRYQPRGGRNNNRGDREYVPRENREGGSYREGPREGGYRDGPREGGYREGGYREGGYREGPREGGGYREREGQYRDGPRNGRRGGRGPRRGGRRGRGYRGGRPEGDRPQGEAKAQN